MKKTVFELLDEQKEIRSQISKLIEGKEKLSDEETRSLEGFEKQIKDIDQKIVELRAEAPADVNKVNIVTRASTAQVKTPEAFDLKTRSFEDYIETRALVTTGNIGTDIDKDFVVALAEMNPIRKLARKIRSKTTHGLPVFTAGPTVGIVAEGTASTANDGTAATVIFNAYAYPNTQYISKEMYADAAYDVLSAVDSMAVLGLTGAELAHFYSGTGTGQPQGILVGGTLGVTAASTSTFTGAELLSLKTKLPPQYRTGDEVWIMSQTAEAIARTLVYPNSQIPMWDPTTDKLCGLPVYVSGAMPAVATGAKVAVLANLKWGYAYAVRGEQEVERTFFAEPANRRYGLLIEERIDAKVIIPSAIQYLKMA